MNVNLKRTEFNWMNLAVDTKSGFKSFLNDNQIQSETHTFTVITRVNWYDF